MEKYDSTKYLRQLFHKPNIIPMYGVLLAILYVMIPLNYIPATCYTGFLLPEAEFSQFEPIEFPTIFINGDGSVYLNNLIEVYKVNDVSRLPEILSVGIKDSRFKYLDKILLKADENLEFGRLQNVLKEIKKAEIDIVGLITERVVP